MYRLPMKCWILCSHVRNNALSFSTDAFTGPHLRSLSFGLGKQTLAGTSISTSVKYLTLAEHQNNASGINLLSRLPKLESLFLPSGSCPYDCLGLLPTATLVDLRIDGQFVASGYDSIAACKLLTHLTLARQVYSIVQDYAALLQQLPLLTHAYFTIWKSWEWSDRRSLIPKLRPVLRLWMSRILWTPRMDGILEFGLFNYFLHKVSTI